jgi:uncharacterized protein YkwD
MSRLISRFTAVAIAVAVAAALVPAGMQPAVASTTLIASSSVDAGVDILNELRALSGLPKVTSDSGMRADSRKHSEYMVRTGTIGHHQDPKSPHYTEGGDRAARESNLKVSSSATLSVRAAVEGLMAAPFHGIGLIDPRLERSGGAMFTDAGADRWRSGYTINIIRGRGSSVSAQTTYPIVWPGDGSTVSIDRYRGFETPDPLTGCSGWTAPTGLPLLVQFAADQPITGATVRDPDGKSMGVCAFDRHTYSNPDASLQNSGRSALASRNAAVIIPRHPLAAGRHTVEVRTSAGTVQWGFTVGTENVPATSMKSDTAPPTKQPSIRTTENACPESTPTARFHDVPATAVHARSISCASWWEVAQGTADGLYRPGAVVSRAQMASFIARTITETGGSLPANPRSHFSDAAGSPHATAINQLAQVGIVSGDSSGRYAPNDPVTRAQMATFLVRAYEYRTGRVLQVESGWFNDTAGTSHGTNIDKAAAAGFTGGTGPGRFSPAENVQRGAMGSFVSRVLDLLVEQRWATHQGQ